MEMVIYGIKNKEKICGDVDEPQGIEEWKGVSIEDGEVVEIHWDRFRLKGSLHVEWLPSSLRTFVANTNHLTGTVDLVSLPTAMKELLLGINAFTGSIGLERLPESMVYLNVPVNNLSGSFKARQASGYADIFGSLRQRIYWKR